MGNAVKSFATNVAKAAAKGVISWAGDKIPIIGGPIAGYINSKFAKGCYDIGSPGVAIPEGMKTKEVTTPAQLISLVKKFPDIASKSGLTVEAIKEEVKKSKEEPEQKEEKPSMAKGGKVKVAVEEPEKFAKGGIPKALGAWSAHLKAYRSKHPGVSLKEAMVGASKTYKK
jgi:hypothetical protein